MNNKHFYWIVPIVIILILASLVYGYWEGYTDSDLNYKNQMYFCHSKGLIFCGDNVGGTEFQCGTGSCWKDSERFFYANPSLELIKVVNQDIKELEDLKECNRELKWQKYMRDYYIDYIDELENKIYEGYNIEKVIIDPNNERGFYIQGNEIYLSRGWEEETKKCNLIGIKISNDFAKENWEIVSFYDNDGFSIKNYNNNPSKPLEVEFICAKEKDIAYSNEPNEFKEETLMEQYAKEKYGEDYTDLNLKKVIYFNKYCRTISNEDDGTINSRYMTYWSDIGWEETDDIIYTGKDCENE